MIELPVEVILAVAVLVPVVVVAIVVVPVAVVMVPEKYCVVSFAAA